MADDRGLSNTPSPLGGAALRQARRREQRLFSEPPPPSNTTQGLWTQFSGMPNQPGSPTSLHEWLQSVDDAVLAADVGPGAKTFPASSSSTASSRNSSLDSFSAADFLSSGISQERVMNSPSANMDQHFGFGLPQGFDSSADFGSPADFGHLHSPQFTHSPADPMSPLSADMSAGLPSADFTHPPPDFTFQSHPGFSHPPPHHNFNEFLTAHSASGYSPREAAVGGDGQIGSSLPAFEGISQSRPAMPTCHGSLPGHIDVPLPSPTFTGFSSIADDLFFQGPVDPVETSSQSCVSSFESVTPPQKKMQRQNSEPLYGRTMADEGKAMYVDTLRRLNSFGPPYEPFGSAVQPHDTDNAQTSVDEVPANTCKPAKSKELPKKEPPKPSYSDVAKANKGKPPHPQTDTVGNETTEPEIFSKVSTEPSQQRAHRHPVTRRSFTHTRIMNHRSKTMPSDGGHSTYVQPNSRYGLDQFEDVSGFAGTEQRSSSVESLNSQHHHGVVRRSSNSSISSGTSAVEENHNMRLPANSAAAGMDTVGSHYSISGKDIPQDRVYNNSHISTPSSAAQAQHRSASSPSPPAAKTLKNERLFFDPKRIFQGKTGSKMQGNLTDKSKSSEERGRSDKQSAASKEETVLNNGKPNNTSSKASAAPHRKTDYINNDLREGSSTSASSSSSSGSKRTNQTAAFNRHGHNSRKNSSKEGLLQSGAGTDRSRRGEGRGRRHEHENDDDNSFIRNIDWVLVDEWMKYISDCSMTFARNSFSAVLTLFLYLLGIIMYLAVGAIHLIAIGLSKLWTMVKSRIFKDQASGSWTRFPAGPESARKRFGVEENITLPATGEEAMKRLLACKGKDPYSILGLRADASDDEIKRYYRRQAVLVHPDKNQEPGAEEAFKILGHAFEMIGEPTKRKEYDAHIFEASEAEAAMREFSDLLTKLQEKVQEAANMMRCDHCGGKHRRIPVDRAWYSARYCDRCNIHHSAKEGDVWAESSMLGFLWHYYACMDNSIYDITEWVSCQRDHFKHMKANAHPVFYRIQTDSSRRHRQGQSGEADLEDFINRLFNKASMSPDGASHSGWQFPSQQAGAQSGWGASSTSTSSSSSSKRSRRKKKRN